MRVPESVKSTTTVPGFPRPAGTESTIVAEQRFILATRETGYRDLSASVAELIDNSIQAGARDIRVFVREQEWLGENVRAIAVLDDGCGMNAETLVNALRFGGSERFDDRSGLGRFGMGLPNSSLSQARRVDVFSWEGPGDYLHTYLDVDDVASARMRTIPEPVLDSLPAWLATEVPATGTLVLWTRCDRLVRFTPATVARRLAGPLGRLFRYAIWNGVRISIDGALVRPVDPLFLKPEAGIEAAIPFGPPLSYEFRTKSGSSSSIDVRFTELPVEGWHHRSIDEKRRAGIVGNAGVSIVRAGREIDYGWHLMGKKRRENYDDWWRCEIRFSPELDEVFGVTHSKQGITPTAELRAAIGPDLEQVARTLNARVRNAFKRVKSTIPSPAAQQATCKDQYLPPVRAPFGTLPAFGLKYRIEAKALSGPEFYQVSRDGNSVVITLNQEHPFYTELYRPVLAPPTVHERYRLECLVLAAVRAELDFEGNEERLWVDRMRVAWSDALAAFLDS